MLVSTAARFEFPVILASVARMAEAYWTVPTAERRADILRICGPLYRRTPRNPEASRRARVRHGTALHVNGPDKERARMDVRAAPAGVRCPVLVMAGDHDPVSPIAFSETIVASLPPGRVRFSDSRHGGSAMHRSAPSRS
ncbi:hypothetical protein FF100_10605 [Methylobacterium terricola]|uniref:Peptidase S33 tripeptidyl aminopeptidase-like C-terminal domain-containing protein n=1 Tax=Methylobacterium terricola TaxID=2583531 RepID=A0A5C4LGL8_9HYPH|nr:alpha/beta hydrolase [Methylobacterium terricola]TNC13267.1 hypothetical protein FF100_10605 [Methylobacterium terricola]